MKNRLFSLVLALAAGIACAPPDMSIQECGMHPPYGLPRQVGIPRDLTGVSLRAVLSVFAIYNNTLGEYLPDHRNVFEPYLSESGGYDPGKHECDGRNEIFVLDAERTAEIFGSDTCQFALTGRGDALIPHCWMEKSALAQQTVELHEFGHLLGLDDVEDCTCVMQNMLYRPMAPDGYVYLTEEDIDQFCSIYPCTQPSGS